MSNKCWTRQSGGGKYVVCNDPPRGSRGQAGVYKADNPTGKQNPKLKERERKEKEKQIRERDIHRQEHTTKYGKYKDPVPKNAPSTDSMRNQLIKGGARESSVEGMGKRYIYKRWKSETTKGKAFAKKVKAPKPRPSRKGEGIRKKPLTEGGGSLAYIREYLSASNIPQEHWGGWSAKKQRAEAGEMMREEKRRGTL